MATMKVIFVICLLIVFVHSWSEELVQTEGGVVRGVVQDVYRSFKVKYLNEIE